MNIHCVLNPSDPSGMGMYSKTGKFTTEIYSVFRRKEEIMHGKPKFLRVKRFTSNFSVKISLKVVG